MSEALKQAVWRYARGRAGPDGFATTPIEGVGMMIAAAPTGLLHAIYKPLLCLVLQGGKQVSLAGETHAFAAGQSLVVAHDAPIVGRVTRASAAAPYLALSLELDMALLRELAGPAAPEPAPPRRSEPALFVDETDEAVADYALRLVRLLERPEAAPVLRPAIVREMHYWLLAGRHGAALRRLPPPDAHAPQIARAMALLRADFARTVSVERLAEAAGMSASSFHRHFKALASLSPLQFQKRLRLIEARRLMLADGLAAGEAGYAVGYESASQFSRDYARLYGAPPRRAARAANATA